MRWMLVALLLVGCQSEKEGWQLICDAPSKIEQDVMDPSERAHRLTEYIAKHLDNGAVRDAFKAMAAMEADERASFVRSEIAKHGIEDCGGLENVEPPPPPSSSPP